MYLCITLNPSISWQSARYYFHEKAIFVTYWWYRLRLYSQYFYKIYILDHSIYQFPNTFRKHGMLWYHYEVPIFYQTSLIIVQLILFSRVLKCFDTFQRLQNPFNIHASKYCVTHGFFIRIEFFHCLLIAFQSIFLCIYTFQSKWEFRAMCIKHYNCEQCNAQIISSPEPAIR